MGQAKQWNPNLSPGNLRIIPNFGKRPHVVGHVYGRRKIGPADELFEFDLDRARDDLVEVDRARRDRISRRPAMQAPAAARQVNR